MDARGNFRLRLARQPAKRLCRLAASKQLARILFRNSGNQRDGTARIRHLGRNGKNRVYGDRHRQLASLAIVDDPAFGRDFFGALLLMLRALLEAAVAEDLQIDQAKADDPAPENKDACEKVEPEIRAVAGCAGGHW